MSNESTERIAADIIIAQLNSCNGYMDAKSIAKDFQTIYDQIKHCDSVGSVPAKPILAG